MGVVSLLSVSSMGGRGGDFQFASGTASYVGDRMSQSIEMRTGATAHITVASFGAANSIRLARSRRGGVGIITSASAGTPAAGASTDGLIW